MSESNFVPLGEFPKMGVAVVRLPDGKLRTVKLSQLKGPQPGAFSPATAGSPRSEVRGYQTAGAVPKRRPVIQPTGSVVQNETLAADAAPELEAKLAAV